MVSLGLRFDPRDGPLLRGLANRVRSGDLSGQAANVFDQAALAAETGQPLELHCDSPIEAVELAAAYIRFGVRQPNIEQLSGNRR